MAYNTLWSSFMWFSAPSCCLSPNQREVVKLAGGVVLPVAVLLSNALGVRYVLVISVVVGLVL